MLVNAISLCLRLDCLVNSALDPYSQWSGDNLPEGICKYLRTSFDELEQGNKLPSWIALTPHAQLRELPRSARGLKKWRD
jgi:hypothetical protein